MTTPFLSQQPDLPVEADAVLREFGIGRCIDLRERKMAEEIGKLRIALAADEADAARIEWLEAHAWEVIDGAGNMRYSVAASGGGVRAAIDAAMAAQEAGRPHD